MQMMMILMMQIWMRRGVVVVEVVAVVLVIDVETSQVLRSLRRLKGTMVMIHHGHCMSLRCALGDTVTRVVKQVTNVTM